MLVTMRNSELIDQLVEIAGGDIRLVEEAIQASAEHSEVGAELKDVVHYIVERRTEAEKAATPAAA